MPVCRAWLLAFSFFAGLAVSAAVAVTNAGSKRHHHQSHQARLVRRAASAEDGDDDAERVEAVLTAERGAASEESEDSVHSRLRDERHAEEESESAVEGESFSFPPALGAPQESDEPVDGGAAAATPSDESDLLEEGEEDEAADIEEDAVVDGTTASRREREGGGTCVLDRKSGCADDFDCCEAGSGCYRIDETACNPAQTKNMLGLDLLVGNDTNVTNPSWCLLTIPECKKKTERVDVYYTAVTEGLP